MSLRVRCPRFYSWPCCCLAVWFWGKSVFIPQNLFPSNVKRGYSVLPSLFCYIVVKIKCDNVYEFKSSLLLAI